MQTTANLGLKKPEGTDVVNIDDLNNNSDILDAEITNIKNGTTKVAEASNADSATSAGKLTTARTIAATGDIAGSLTFDGSANASMTTTLATVATAGIYKSVTVDAKGRVTSGTNPTTLSGYGITDAAPSSHVGATGNAHGVATSSVNGFMSSTDKSKLDGIASGADAVADSTTNGNILINGTETNVYTHPSGDGNLHVPATGTTNSGKVLTSGATAGSLSWSPLPTSLPANGGNATTVNGKTAADTPLTTEKTDLVGMVNELFNNANNGKSSVASAIGSPTTATETFAQIAADINARKSTLATNLTNKGQTASASDTLSNLVSKVNNIARGQGVAVESQVRAGITFSNSDGTLRTGNLAVQSTTAVTITPGASDIVKPAGIYDAAITVKGTTPEALGGYSVGAIPENEQQTILELAQTRIYVKQLAGNPVIDSVGNVYVADGSGYIFKYDINGNLIWYYQLSLSSGQYLVNLMIDIQDNLLICSSIDIHKIAKNVNPNTTAPIWLYNIGFVPSNCIYVYDGTRELLVLLDPTDNWLFCKLLSNNTTVFRATLDGGGGSRGTVLYNPVTQCLYVANTLGGFSKIPISSSGTSVVPTNFWNTSTDIRNYHSLDVDSVGNIYCAMAQNSVGCTIYKISTTGAILMTINVTDVSINNIIVDDNDNIYILGSKSTTQVMSGHINLVEKYTSSGVKLWEYRLLGDQIFHLMADKLGYIYVKDNSEVGNNTAYPVFKISTNQKIIA